MAKKRVMWLCRNDDDSRYILYDSVKPKKRKNTYWVGNQTLAVISPEEWPEDNVQLNPGEGPVVIKIVRR